MKCGCSRQKIWRIIKKLEEDKTIWGYAAIVNEEKQGLKSYIILIKRTTLPIDEKLAINHRGYSFLFSVICL